MGVVAHFAGRDIHVLQRPAVHRLDHARQEAVDQAQVAGIALGCLLEYPSGRGLGTEVDTTPVVFQRIILTFHFARRAEDRQLARVQDVKARFPGR